eukprot:gnl/TRDRNA2_/TRDRNA2_199239_c0_seq1.p1 gnl/TRDRNA2_/TRDRNA2_199239_c0~~gnl/TRDRNA2_/TRDRNA2_199239_c0_seq1.p1  ORF type:complete len:413 (+),score=46.76 gnl/TRDRNA2_/TRDRNA2_199239_c0_seq1:156-1394(+)
MLTITLAVLITLAMKSQAKQMVATRIEDTHKLVNQISGMLPRICADRLHGSTDKNVDKLVEGLRRRVLRARPWHHADVDGTMIGKLAPPAIHPGVSGKATTEASPAASTPAVGEVPGVKWDKWLQRTLMAGAAVAAGKVVLQLRQPLPQEWVPQTHDSSSWIQLTRRDFVEPDRLMAKKGRTAAESERAAFLYRTMLEQVDPSSSEATVLRKRTADALNAVMRLRTNGNLLMIDGMQDTPEHKRIWSRFAPAAAKLSKAAWVASPNDPEACYVYAEASMYEGSAKGIVRNALTGGAQLFLRNARALQKWPLEESGFGLCLEGAYHLSAPRPLKNNKKALDLFQKATAISKTRRNLYHAGLAHYRLGEMELAVEAWRRSLAAPSGSRNEADIAAYIASQARKGIEAATRHLSS